MAQLLSVEQPLPLAPGNDLLDSLPRADMNRLETLLTRFEMRAHSTFDGGIVFPLSGLLSLQFSGSPLEFGMVGSEGFVDLSALKLGGRREPHVEVLDEGEAYAIHREKLKECLLAIQPLAELLLTYNGALIHQVGETAIATGLGSVEQRLIRRLLMLHDRIGRRGLSLTHEKMAHLLGVRRASVTIALQILEGERLIRSTRGSIELMDFRGLVARAHTFYTPVKRSTRA